jgi:TRAP-type transport system periplasmic protein
MRRRWKTIVVLAAVSTVVLWSAGGGSGTAAETYEFKISLESPAKHPRTLIMADFISELINRSEGRLKPTLYHSAQLYKDAHVIKPVHMGVVQMAMVGNYLLDGIDINTGVTELPMFFGRRMDTDDNYQLIDHLSLFINKNLEKKLNVKVIGQVFGVGMDQYYTTSKKIVKLGDFKGLKIRHAGGSPATARLEALGAGSVVMSYSDLAMALTQHTIDGVDTTNVSIVSAKLYETGLKYGLECNVKFAYYFPLVSSSFWKSLPPDLQNIFTETWKGIVPRQRREAKQDEEVAKKFLETKGMEFYSPPKEELAKWRNHIMPVQARLVKELKYDPELIKIAEKALGT